MIFNPLGDPIYRIEAESFDEQLCRILKASMTKKKGDSDESPFLINVFPQP